MGLRYGDWPRLGDAGPDRAAAFLFDYTGDTCRQMHHLIEEAAPRVPGGLTVLCVLVPQSSRCNPLVRWPGGGDADARGYARLALGLQEDLGVEAEAAVDRLVAEAGRLDVAASNAGSTATFAPQLSITEPATGGT